MSAQDIARKYFDLSNAGDLESIEKMFVDDATYSSDSVGLYYGKSNIMEMMAGFFGSFAYLNWVIHSVDEKTSNIVEISFTRFSKDKSGSDVEVSGKESLIIVGDKIRHIEVRKL